MSVLPRGQRPGDSVADAANDTSPDWGVTFFNVTHMRIGALGIGGPSAGQPAGQLAPVAGRADAQTHHVAGNRNDLPPGVGREPKVPGAANAPLPPPPRAPQGRTMQRFTPRRRLLCWCASPASCCMWHHTRAFSWAAVPAGPDSMLVGLPLSRRGPLLHCSGCGLLTMEGVKLHSLSGAVRLWG